MSDIEKLRFLSPDNIKDIAQRYGTPVYVYSEKILREQAQKALSFSAPYGLTVRYAMKANPNRHILQIFRDLGLGIDASSGNEVHRAIKAGSKPGDMSVTAQQMPDDFVDLARSGVQFNLSSLEQLRRWGEQLPGTSIGVRMNPGIGSGHVARTKVGGSSSSFGIWHEYIDDVNKIAREYKLNIGRLHTHIGSGADPESWNKAVGLSLDIIRSFPDATTLNIGGGFKVGRMATEPTTDLHAVSAHITKLLRRFARQTGRQLHLETEPGSYLTVGAGSLITKIHDIVDTGTEGYKFIKVDAGMSDFIRPAMYGAQHPLVVVGGEAKKTGNYIVVGKCCESADIFTTAPGQPEVLAKRRLQQAAIGDYLVIEGVGAYSANLNMNGFNSFITSPEVMLGNDNGTRLIRRRQTLDELLETEGSLDVQDDTARHDSIPISASGKVR